MELIKKFVIESIRDIDEILVKHAGCVNDDIRKKLEISRDTYKIVLKKILEFSAL